MRIKLHQIYWHSEKPIFAIDIRKDGIMATGGSDSLVRLWRPTITRNTLGKKHSEEESTSETIIDIDVEYICTLKKHGHPINSLSFHKEDGYLASASDDGIIIIWQQHILQVPIEDETGCLVNEEWVPLVVYQIPGGPDIYDIKWSPDGEFLIIALSSMEIALWSMSQWKILQRTKDHSHFVQGVAWDPLNEFITSISSDRRLVVYKILSSYLSINQKNTNKNIDDNNLKGSYSVPNKYNEHNLENNVYNSLYETTDTLEKDEFENEFLDYEVVNVDDPSYKVNKLPSLSEDRHIQGHGKSNVFNKKQIKSNTKIYYKHCHTISHIPILKTTPSYIDGENTNTIGMPTDKSCTNTTENMSNDSSDDQDKLISKLDENENTLNTQNPCGQNETTSIVAKQYLFYNETMKSFFRRLTFSSDGSLLLLPAGIHINNNVKENCIYIFSRGSLVSSEPPVPICRWGPFPTPVTVIRQSPMLRMLKSEQSNNSFNLPYAFLFAIGTLDGVWLYRSDVDGPIASIKNIHCAGITDLAWMDDGKTLFISSTDGYCSTLLIEDTDEDTLYSQ